MNEFRGIVRLDQPFLEQPEVAEFLQSSPEDSFPRSILYRLLSVTERFLQSQWIDQYPKTELTTLCLNCKSLEVESNCSRFYSIAWQNEFNDQNNEQLNNEINNDLNLLAGRIHEFLVMQLFFDQKERIFVESSLTVSLSTTTIGTSPPDAFYSYGIYSQARRILFNSETYNHRPCKFKDSAGKYYLFDPKEKNFLHPLEECPICN